MEKVEEIEPWRSEEFRDSMTWKIQSAIGACENLCTNNCHYLERQLYLAASCDDEYLKSVAQLFVNLQALGKMFAAGPVEPLRDDHPLVMQDLGTIHLKIYLVYKLEPYTPGMYKEYYEEEESVADTSDDDKSEVDSLIDDPDDSSDGFSDTSNSEDENNTEKNIEDKNNTADEKNVEDEKKTENEKTENEKNTDDEKKTEYEKNTEDEKKTENEKNTDDEEN